MAGDEQSPIDTSACVPAHELEDHDRSEIDILRENLRGPEAESVPVASPFRKVSPLVTNFEVSLWRP
jgi:hypothetical protein